MHLFNAESHLQTSIRLSHLVLSVISLQLDKPQPRSLKQVLKQLFIQKVKDVLKEKDINITPNKWRQKIKDIMCLDEYEETILKRMKLEELTID